MELEKPLAIAALILAVIALVSVFIKPVTVGADAVDTSQLKDGAVTEDKLADDAVTSDKIAGNAVDNTKIVNGVITLAKLAAEVLARMPVLPLASDNLADNAVTENKIRPSAVDSSKIRDNSIRDADINDAADITGSKLKDNTVAGAKLVDGAVTANKMAIKIQDSRNEIAATGTTITFSPKFPAPPTVVATLSRTDSADNFTIFITAVTTDNFTAIVYKNGAASAENIYWIAIYTP